MDQSTKGSSCSLIITQCLISFVQQKSGKVIFMLLKAIKQQVSKGPLDAINGKARYTLSDDRLLKEDIEHKTLVRTRRVITKKEDKVYFSKLVFFIFSCFNCVTWTDDVSGLTRMFICRNVLPGYAMTFSCTSETIVFYFVPSHWATQNRFKYRLVGSLAVFIQELNPQ